MPTNQQARCSHYKTETETGMEQKIRTTISPTSPYSYHKTPSSNSSTIASECCRVRRVDSPSKSSGLAEHLIQNEKDAMTLQKQSFLLRTPTLHNARKERLLRIVGDIGTKSKYDAPEVTIWAAHHFWCCHSGLEGLEDCCKRLME